MVLLYAPFVPRIYRKGAKLMKSMLYLEDAVHRRLKYLALDENVSMAELIRRAVDEYLMLHWPLPGEEKVRYGRKRKGGGGQ